MDQMPSDPCYAWILENIRPIVPVPCTATQGTGLFFERLVFYR